MPVRVKYVYLKAKPRQPILTTVFQNKNFVTSGVLMFMGLSIISLVAWPIFSFHLIEAPKLRPLLNPVPAVRAGVLGIVAPVKANTNDSVLAYSDTNVDYGKASNWFPDVIQPDQRVGQGNSYKISVPKLGINDATAIVGGENLSESLIHFGGTALPGDYGNAVIFGHSTLPFFYNPKDYKTIFSTLPKLKEGDEIFAEYDGIKYRYVVEEMLVVKPQDIQVLEQKFDDSYLTLVTCVPPGTYLERLIVRARLKSL